MFHRSLLVASHFLAATTLVAMAQSAPFFTRPNEPLHFAAIALTTNGIAGLTNGGARLMVSGVSAISTHGGSVSLVNTQAWVRRYRGASGSANQPAQVIVDKEGSVLVTGFSPGAGTGWDFVVLKYASDGSALWTNRYDGVAHGDDRADFIAVDGAGNVHVTGASFISADHYEVVTIKCSGAGAGIWTNHYNSSATNYDFPAGFVVDATGNVFVAVSTFTGVSPYIVLKYDPAGNAVWTNRYKASTNGQDYPATLALDGTGGVVVTGNSDGPDTGTDYGTVRYGGDGTPLWTNRYHRTYTDLARNLVVDQAGSVIVTGDSMGVGSPLCATVKYAADGAALWTNFIVGPNYSGGGVPRVVADLAGNIFVTSGSPGANSIGDYHIVKLTGAGLPVWTNHYIGLGNSNGWIAATTTDSAGNFYLAGYTIPPGRSNRDYIAIKFSPAGMPIWTNRYNGPADSEDHGFALAVDAQGNAYVTGESADAAGKYDYATVKFADQVHYTPPQDFAGTDTFTFSVVDYLGVVATGAVTVVVAPPMLQLNTTAAMLRMTPGGMQLQVDGAHGTGPVLIYASSNLMDWESIVTNPPVLGSFQFLDTKATNQPRRFYRAREQP